MKTIPLTCVVTSYNDGDHLLRAIRSILNGTVQPNEVLISDDCSSDESFKRACEAFRGNPRIKFIQQEKNLGVSENRNTAIEFASNDLITTLDGDDLVAEGKFEREFLKVERGASVVYSNTAQVIGARRTFIGILNNRKTIESESSVLASVYGRKGPLPKDIMFYKKHFFKAGRFDPMLCLYEDWDFKIRLSSIAPLWTFSEGVGTIYWKHNTGLSSAHKKRHKQAIESISKKNYATLLLQRLQDVEPGKESSDVSNALPRQRGGTLDFSFERRGPFVPSLVESVKGVAEVMRSVRNVRNIDAILKFPTEN